MVTAITPHNPQILRPAAKLAEILAARLCHDLAGLTGSLGGALELAEEDAEALSVARDSALALHARLTLLRAAFGPADAAQTMGTHNSYHVAPPDAIASRAQRLAFDLQRDQASAAVRTRPLQVANATAHGGRTVVATERAVRLGDDYRRPAAATRRLKVR